MQKNSNNMKIDVKDIMTSKNTPEQIFILAIQKAMTARDDYMLDMFKAMIGKKRTVAEDLLINDYLSNK